MLVGRGQPAPAWTNDRPELLPGEEFYLNAFWDLNTERHVGMSLGHIPCSKIRAYGAAAGLDSDTMELFVAVIRVMDSAFIKWAIEQQERARKHAAQPTKPPSP